MKISKRAKREARQLFRLCLVNRVLDEDRVRHVVQRVVAAGRRDCPAILSHVRRLMRLELARHTATIESVTVMPADVQAAIEAALMRRYGPGVAKIEGVTDAMLTEMIDLGNGVTGLVLNLEETEVGVIILGDYTQLKEGSEARTTGGLLQVPVGKSLLGRVVNVLGQPLDGKG